MAVDIDTLQIEIEASSDVAAKRVQDLADALSNLKSNAKGGAGLTTVSKQLQALVTATNGGTSASNKITKLSAALSSLSNIQKSTGLSSSVNALNKLKGLDLSGISTEKMQSLASALNTLGSVQKASGLASTINALKKLPSISEELEKADLGKFASQMERVAASVRPLATEMQKVSNGFAAFPIRIQKIIASNTGLVASNQKAAKSFNLFGSGITGAISKLTIWGFGIKQVSKKLSDWILKSNDYVENLNLFNVAMGDYAQEAYNYAYAVRDAVGIDPSEWMRNQGVFKQITSGFGVVADKANLMSKNLTQIGYDISSFFNIGIEESMQKVQSGIAGELEPLRRLGYALDVATLQQIAYDYGIKQNINTMTQAQKSQLRYLAIMEQSTNVMGDMARTVQTPANALRILNQQITQLNRAWGNLFIPLLQKTLPYAQAFVEVLTDAVQRLAILLGFKLPTIDYSGMDGIAGGAENAGDAIEDTTDKVKELKNSLLGIDELNVLSVANNDTLEGIGDNNLDLNFELPEYDFLKGLSSQMDEITEKMKTILYDYVIPIAAGLAAWKISQSIFPELNRLQTLLGGLMIAAGLTLLIESIKDILFGDGLTWKNILQGGAGGILAGAGLGFLLAKRLGLTWAGGMLLGAIVGLGLSLMVMSIASQIKDGLNIGNVLLNAVGGALAGAALGGYLAWKTNSLFMAQGVIGGLVAGVGLSLLISSVVSILKDGLNFGNAVMGVIGGALAGLGIGTIVGGGVKAAFGLIVGIGLALVIEGLTAQISSGAASLSGGLMTILGSALAGAGIGSVIPVIGTAGGALLGLGVGIVLEILGIQEAGKVAYEASEDFQIMQNILGQCADASDRTSTAFDNLKAGIERFDSISADFGVASQLADEIFDISENANASAYELNQMKVKIDVLNGLGIDGLSLSIDETTGRVKESRAEVEKLIQSLEKEARMEALKDILVQSYKDQYQAMSDMANAARDYDAANQALLKTTSELDNADWFDFAKKAKLKAAQDKEREAVEATQSAYMESLSLYKELDDAVANYTGYLVDLKTGEATVGYGVVDGLDEAKTALDTFKSNNFGIEQWEMVGQNIGNGIASGINSSTDVISSAARNAIDSARIASEHAAKIHSPSKLFRDKIGLNIGLGVAGGISDSTRQVVDMAKNLLNRVQASMTQSVDVSNISIASRRPAFSISREAIQNSSYNFAVSEETGDSGDASNRDVINAIMAMASMVTKAVNEKDQNIILDGRQVSRGLEQYNQRLTKERGRPIT